MAQVKVIKGCLLLIRTLIDEFVAITHVAEQGFKWSIDMARPMSRQGYTISYRDGQRNRCEFCAYANDSFEARQVAMETVKFIHEHPNAIDHILRSS